MLLPPRIAPTSSTHRACSAPTTQLPYVHSSTPLHALPSACLITWLITWLATWLITRRTPPPLTMAQYEAGGFMYHATMPTDALVIFRDVMLETQQFGFQAAHDNAWDLGRQVRQMMCEEKQLVSTAAAGFEAPGVVVVHTSDAAVAGKFIKAGTQIAAGVPFMIGEPSDTKTFRIGLFGLDKLKDPTKTAYTLRTSLDQAVPDEVVKNLSGYIRSDASLKKALK